MPSTVSAKAKAEAIRELAAREGYSLEHCYAYSDSITDLPMLETVGHPSVVNPDRGLRKEAATRDWPVLTFSRPVPLRDRLPPHPRGRPSPPPSPSDSARWPVVHSPIPLLRKVLPRTATRR